MRASFRVKACHCLWKGGGDALYGRSSKYLPSQEAMKAAGRSREARIPAAESALRLLEGDDPFAAVDSMAGADGLASQAVQS